MTTKNLDEYERIISEIIRLRMVDGSTYQNQCSLIVRELGERTSQGYDGGNKEFVDGLLKITYDNYGNNMSVYWKDEPILSTQTGNLRYYRKDKGFERVIEALWQKARTKERFNKTKERVEHVNDLMELWGITDEEISLW